MFTIKLTISHCKHHHDHTCRLDHPSSPLVYFIVVLVVLRSRCFSDMYSVVGYFGIFEVLYRYMTF